MSIKTIISNIKFLLKNDIKEKFQQKNEINYLIEEQFISLRNIHYPFIIDVFKTIDLIANSKHSIVRFGDGEINLIQGKTIPFQKASTLLSERLVEVLSSNKENLEVGIPLFIYSDKSNLIDLSRNFWSGRNGKYFRDTIQPYLLDNKIYCSAEFTIANTAYKNFNSDLYFEKLQELWRGRTVTIICGENVFSNISYNIFECAKRVNYIKCPSLNAFDQYDHILKKSLQISKEDLVIVILGPTAKVLVFDLCNIGYQALDLGHIAKSYDWYKKKKSTISEANAFDFFRPD